MNEIFSKPLKFIAILFAILLLTVGQISYIEKYTVYGLPYNWAIAIFYVLIFLSSRKIIYMRFQYISAVALLMFFGVLLSFINLENVSLIGFLKYFETILLVFGVLLLATRKDIDDKNIMLVLIIFYMLMLLANIAYKIPTGLFDREIGYLIFGPIVFGRVMAIGLIASQFYFDNIRYKICFMLLFFLGVLMSQSKGPLLALFVVELIAIYFFYNYKKNLLLLGLALFSIFLFSDFSDLNNNRYSSAINEIKNIVNNDTQISVSENSGSVTIRLGMIYETIKIISQKPFGVGMGNWGDATSLQWLEYPHNFILEAISELGYLSGILFLLPYFIFMKGKKNVFTLLAIFYFISSMSSGDITDSRFILVYAIFSILIVKDKRYE